MEMNVGYLEQEFRKRGGVFENLSLIHRKGRGFACESREKTKKSVIFCPDDLMIDIADVSLTGDALHLNKPEKYGDNAEFLDQYLAFHFNSGMVNELLEFKKAIESIPEADKALLSRVNLPHGHGTYSDDESFVINRIAHSHCIQYENPVEKRLMPFVSFLNHDKEGIPFARSVTQFRTGIHFEGQFDGEAFAFYNHSDPLNIFMSYGFVSDAQIAYSLPLGLRISAEKSLLIQRDVLNDSPQGGNQRWPLVRMEGADVVVSWFPLDGEKGHISPPNLAAALAQQLGLSGEQLLYAILRHNLSILYPLAFALQASNNAYSRHVGDCVRKQLELLSRPPAP